MAGKQVRPVESDLASNVVSIVDRQSEGPFFFFGGGGGG